MRQGQSDTVEHGYDKPNPFSIQQNAGAVREPPLKETLLFSPFPLGEGAGGRGPAPPLPTKWR